MQKEEINLHEAAASGQVEVIKGKLWPPHSVDAKDEEGWTPVMLAATRGHIETVHALLQLGAAVSITNNYGITVFTLAVLNGDEYLLHKLYCFLPTELKRTESHNALQVACFKGFYSLSRWLLENTEVPSQINLTSPLTELTVLQLAVLKGHEMLVELLIHAGADPNITSSLGQNAFTLAGSEKKMLSILSRNLSPEKSGCFRTKRASKSPAKFTNPLFTANKILLDIEREVVLKNSPGRPVFKTIDDSYDDSKTFDESIVISPCQNDIFSSPRTPKKSKTNKYSLGSLMSPRLIPYFLSLKPTVNSPGRNQTKEHNRKAKKNSDNTGPPLWLKFHTKRRSKSLDNSGAYCSLDSIKREIVDFQQLLLKFGLESFYSVFKEQEIDFLAFLTLSAEDLTSMGIFDKMAQTKILNCIDTLQNNQF